VKRDDSVAPVIGSPSSCVSLGLRHLLGDSVDLAGRLAERFVALLSSLATSRKNLASARSA
jgi:hypothetical protein